MLSEGGQLRATIDAARWYVRLRLATIRDRWIAPEKRHVIAALLPNGDRIMSTRLANITTMGDRAGCHG
jgi:hypothetical protein